MNLLDPLTLFIVLVVAFWGGTTVGYKLRGLRADQPAAPTEPRVVVNVPPDWKPLATLPPTQIEGARATLYWTVYSKTIEAFDGDMDDMVDYATRAAEDAVDKVFGPLES